jgi:hypothetical protein
MVVLVVEEAFVVKMRLLEERGESLRFGDSAAGAGFWGRI